MENSNDERRHEAMLPVTLRPWRPSKTRRHETAVDGVTAWATEWMHIGSDRAGYCCIETMETFTTVFLDSRREQVEFKGPRSLALAPALVLATVLQEAAALAQGESL